MRKRLAARVAVALLASGLASAQDSLAGVPYGPNSDLPPWVLSCPAGDMEYRVVIRDALNNPVVGCCVGIVFETCTGAALCPGSFHHECDPYDMVQAVADSAGAASLRERDSHAGLRCRIA